MLLHTMDVIKFPPDAQSIGIPHIDSTMSVLLIINVIIFRVDASIGRESSEMSVFLSIAVLSNFILIPGAIHSAHPMWYLIDMRPTVPALLPIEALLGC